MKNSIEVEAALRLALSVLKAKDTCGSSIREAKERAIAAAEEALMSVPDGAQPAVSETHEQSTPCGEPVAWIEGDEPILTWTKTEPKAIPLYTTPQKCKPLTDEQILRANQVIYNGMTCVHIQEDGEPENLLAFARAIEAAHGIYAPPELKE